MVTQTCFDFTVDWPQLEKIFLMVKIDSCLKAGESHFVQDSLVLFLQVIIMLSTFNI